MCAPQKVVLSNGTVLEGGLVDCMENTCDKSVRYGKKDDAEK